MEVSIKDLERSACRPGIKARCFTAGEERPKFDWYNFSCTYVSVVFFFGSNTTDWIRPHESDSLGIISGLCCRRSHCLSKLNWLSNGVNPASKNEFQLLISLLVGHSRMDCTAIRIPVESIWCPTYPNLSSHSTFSPFPNGKLYTLDAKDKT